MNQKLKYHIKRYRSINDVKLEIEFGKMNFLMGGNESGKSNLLKAIHLMGKNSKEKYIENIDKLKLAAWFENETNQKKEKLKKELREKNSNFKILEKDKENEISLGGEQIWLIKNSFYHNKIKKLFKNCEKELASICINEPKKAIKINEIINEIKDKFISEQKINIFLELIVNNKKEKIKNFSLEIKNIYEETKINLPKTYFIEPFKKSTKSENLSYKIADIKKSKSLIRKIFESFGNSEQVKKLYNHEGIEVDRDVVNQRSNLMDYINEKIKKYFNKFSFIKAFPSLKDDNGIVYLNINEKKDYKYEIHIDDENERSIGFKYFSRLILELKALSETTNNNEKIIYMIDEPEQCLHPLLQEELIKEIKEIVSKNKNLSIILATHSIYSFNLNDRINLIKRLSEKENNKNFYGETLILPIKNFDHVKKLHKNNKDPENEYILKMILDKIKIKLVDNEFAFTIQKIRDEDEEKFNKGKICFEEYVEKRNEKKHNYMNKKINE